MWKKILLTIFLLLFSTSCLFSSSITIGCDVTELINAINSANSDPNHTTIHLDEACLYNLTAVDNYIDHQEALAGPSGDTGATGLPPITTPITIEGHEATIQRLVTASPPDFRIFFVTHNGDLTLNEVSLFGGSVHGVPFGHGGGIYVNEGILTLNQSHVMYNSVEDLGGGIYNDGGMINIDNSSVSFNEANTGGSIYNIRGTVTINGYSLINNNSASEDGGGIENRDGELSIIFSHVNDNEAGRHGGAIHTNRIWSSTTLTLDDVLFEGNLAYGDGGAIRIKDSAFTVTDCTFLDNQAIETPPNESFGGAVFISDTGGIIDGGSDFGGNYTGGPGGAIWVGQTGGALVTIEDTTIQNNSAGTRGGGVASIGNLSIINSTITGNTSQTQGGGVDNQGELSVQNSGITGNSSVMYGGGICSFAGTLDITDSALQGNQTAGDGGGLWSNYTIVTIDGDTVFDGNTAQGDGGGIFNGQDSILSLEESTIANNHAVDIGGGITNVFTGDMTISTSTISGNTSDQSGGGVWNGADMLITQSTINDNTAAVSAGGIGNSANLTMINSTVSGNEAQIVGGISAGYSTTIADSTIAHNTSTSTGAGGLDVHFTAALEIKNSIVAFNTPADCDLQGAVALAGENLDYDGSCTGFTITADPLLGPLTNNGGPTDTHALLVSSPAIDAATDCTDTNGVAVTVDQRDVPRPQGPLCDLGAYEFSMTLPPPPPGVTPTPPEYWCEDLLGVTLLDDGRMRIQLSTTGLPAGVYEATAGNDDFTCETFYDDYPDRLFCYGPRGRGGTLTTLTIFDPLGLPFCEWTFSIPAPYKPELPGEPQEVDCSKYTSEDTCNADPECAWSRAGQCTTK